MGAVFGSEKKTSVNETYSAPMDSYNVTTDESQTSSSISEVTTGLQGQDAVQLATVMEAGGTDRATLTSKTLESLYQTVGNSYQQLVGGANALIQTSQAVAGQGVEQTGLFAQSMENIYGQGLETTKYISQQGGQAISQAAMTTRSIQGVEESSLEKYVPLLIGGLLLIIIFKGGMLK